jgi:clorobiocin biosynthesis protein CloN6
MADGMLFDIVLAHAPSVYDFRNRDDVLFAYLSNSDSVHVSSIFEMPPVGIIALKQHLERRGFKAEFFNIASRMLSDPEFDVEAFLKSVPARYFGVDLHWLAHAHGAVELARLYKELHPSAKTLVGGISSTYYHEELAAYPQIDYVVRGYDTLLPVELLLKAEDRPEELLKVPNLTWKRGGEVVVNELGHTPSSYTAAVDWREVLTGDGKAMTPYNLVIPQSGCEYCCRWCGGSKYFFRKYMGVKKIIQKTPEMLRDELKSVADAARGAHTVTMIDFWHEYHDLLDVACDVFLDADVNYLHYSLHRLPTVETGRKMSRPAKAIIELSPDSHDLAVARAGGRGKYTMEDMERFIDALLDEVYSWEIYFMIGLPRQTAASVRETVQYCEHLLRKYRKKKVVPFICPMLPFLDPGSMIYDNAEKWGYRIFHRSLEQHRQALLSMSWKDRLNYETKWLSREELVDVSYESVRALTLLKNKYGMLPDGITEMMVGLIDSTRGLLGEMDAYQGMPEGPKREEVGRGLRARILQYNRQQFKMVRSQQRPVDLGFARRQWFDTDEAFQRVMQPSAT